jgi:hypothetical protein
MLLISTGFSATGISSAPASARGGVDDCHAARRIGARYDRAANLVIQYLNRLIGLVSRNLSSDKEEDLRGSEPTTSEEQESLNQTIRRSQLNNSQSGNKPR